MRWHGKPFPSVYDSCLDLLGIDDRSRILAVGDSLRTDIAGAARAGIDSVLIIGGIHADKIGAFGGRSRTWGQSRVRCARALTTRLALPLAFAGDAQAGQWPPECRIACRSPVS